MAIIYRVNCVAARSAVDQIRIVATVSVAQIRSFAIRSIRMRDAVRQTSNADAIVVREVTLAVAHNR